MAETRQAIEALPAITLMATGTDNTPTSRPTSRPTNSSANACNQVQRGATKVESVDVGESVVSAYEMQNKTTPCTAVQGVALSESDENRTRNLWIDSPVL